MDVDKDIGTTPALGGNEYTQDTGWTMPAGSASQNTATGIDLASELTPSLHDRTLIIFFSFRTGRGA